MELKIRVIRVVGKYPNRQILGCKPLTNVDNIILNKYNNFTLIDNMLVLAENKDYTVEIKEIETNYGKQYELVSVPSMSAKGINDIDDNMEYEILGEITTGSLVDSIHEAYPNYIRLVLQGKQDEIDLNKIKGVKIYRHNLYCRLINERFKYYHLITNNRHYGLELVDCKALCQVYGTVENAQNALDDNPYYCLIHICGWGFLRADKCISSHRNDLLDSDIRIEFAMIYLLQNNEMEGHTYTTIDNIKNLMSYFGQSAVDKIDKVAEDSELIHYDKTENIMAQSSTYLAECSIADFIKNKVNNSTELDWNWEKFKKIKDGVMTKEQQNVLKAFCKHSLLVLDSASGTGKSSVVRGILDMCDEYGFTYCNLAFTGKASSRLKEQINRPTSTIHRKVLTGDIVEDVLIVDEYSMLSLDLLMMIINAITNEDIRILFVGDSLQIPNLGLGTFAKDVLSIDYIPKCELTHCFRFADGGASYVSTLTRRGEFYLTDEECGQDHIVLGKNKDYEFYKFNGDVMQVVDIYMNLINSGVKPADICVLTPMNKYEYGSTNINNLIQSEINPSKPNEKIMKSKHNNVDVFLRTSDLIMNIKNDYKAINKETYELMEWEDDLSEEDLPTVPIFNGQIGKILSINDKVLKAQIDDEIIVFNKIKCYNLLLAYSSNPFKYQGSSAKYIINLVIPQHSKMLNRNLLYTAQTRQEVKLIEIGDIDTIKHSITKLGDANKRSLLKSLLIK